MSSSRWTEVPCCRMLQSTQAQMEPWPSVSKPCRDAASRAQIWLVDRSSLSTTKVKSKSPVGGVDRGASLMFQPSAMAERPFGPTLENDIMTALPMLCRVVMKVSTSSTSCAGNETCSRARHMGLKSCVVLVRLGDVSAECDVELVTGCEGKDRIICNRAARSSFRRGCWTGWIWGARPALPFRLGFGGILSSEKISGSSANEDAIQNWWRVSSRGKVRDAACKSY